MITTTQWIKIMKTDIEYSDTGPSMRVFFKAVEAGIIATPEFITLKSGRKALIAQYIQFANPYSSSIFAKALPPYLSETEFLNFANFLPAFFTDETRQLSTAEKHDRILTVQKLFRVTNKNIEVFQKISSVIRARYTEKVHDGEHNNSLGGMIIYGISSMGKTYAVSFALSYFFQVIYHLIPPNIHPEAASAETENLFQVAWLKIICPSKGGPITLCDNILSEVDDLLGTNYSKKFKESLGNRTELDIKIYLNKVKKVIQDIHLGVLIIDEIQFLAHCDSKQQIADFLVELSDKIECPLILIGTLEVISAFKDLSFSFKSKFTKQNEVYFDPFPPKNYRTYNSENIPTPRLEYQKLIRVLFKYYQIGKNPISIEDFDHQEKMAEKENKSSEPASLTETFYTETAGITQYTINLFILLQQHINYMEDIANRRAAKSTNTKGKPSINKPVKTTKKLITKIARESFKISRDYLDAIITGNKEKLSNMQDVDYRKFRLEEISNNFNPLVNVNLAQDEYEKNIEIPASMKLTLQKFGIEESIIDQAIKATMDGYIGEPESELLTKAMELCKKLSKKPDKPVQLSPHIERADIDLRKIEEGLQNIQAFCEEQKMNKDPALVPELLHKYDLAFNLDTELDL